MAGFWEIDTCISKIWVLIWDILLVSIVWVQWPVRATQKFPFHINNILVFENYYFQQNSNVNFGKTSFSIEFAFFVWLKFWQSGFVYSFSQHVCIYILQLKLDSHTCQEKTVGNAPTLVHWQWYISRPKRSLEFCAQLWPRKYFIV